MGGGGDPDRQTGRFFALVACKGRLIWVYLTLVPIVSRM